MIDGQASGGGGGTKHWPLFGDVREHVLAGRCAAREFDGDGVPLRESGFRAEEEDGDLHRRSVLWREGAVRRLSPDGEVSVRSRMPDATRAGDGDIEI